jgi:hypothetical protein
MNLFQLITLPLVGFLFVRNVFKLFTGNQSRAAALLGALVWLSAGAAIFRPELTVWIAAILGIGRGADLILYLLAVSYLLSIFFIYNKFRKMESNITEIVRHLALRDGIENSPKNNPEPRTEAN